MTPAGCAPACGHHDVGAVALPAREPPALPAPPRRSGGRPGGGVGVSGGVGVAPTIPTLGDRRASGHSIIGLAVFDRSALRAEALGRCWSQGRFLAWLADSNAQQILLTPLSRW